MKTRYKQKLFLSFVIIFSLFTIGVVLFEQSREKEYKTRSLEEKLEAYADITDTALRQYNNQHQTLDDLVSVLPHNIRLTLIDRNGSVIYDNVIGETSRMENHTERPEIISAREKHKGSNIRTSTSNEHEYLYYAKQYSNYYIRVALPYDVEVQHFLKSDNLFLYYILALFIITLFLINYAAGRFGKSIQKLRDFMNASESNNTNISPMNFPDDELGEIGTKIAQNYERLKESKREIIAEREKLLQHVYSSEEGLCFFSSNKSVEFYNGLFIQYLNTIVDEANSDPSVIFTDLAFKKTNTFLSSRQKQENYFETKTDKQGKTFVIRVNIFENNSFEIIINDITGHEKTRLLKQEMTGNITHELRTPVTSIRGCLETVLEHNLDAEKKRSFIQSAYNQTLALSEIIQDMGLITKIEDAPQSFTLESISIQSLLIGLKEDLDVMLQEKNISIEWNIAGNIIVKGNKNLLYSVFRNLTDNVIRYAGSNVNIQINKYSEDKDFYYFSYSDTGIGIPDERHLKRLFERFYRINEGRTRDTGGSGLGLSIVKNAINFHRGTITVKNRVNGGLEFLFKLPKANK